MRTVMLPVPDALENPVTVRTPLAKLVPNAVPFNNTTDVGTKPLPVMVALKMPSGNCPFDPTPVITGMGGISVTVALALPFGPVAVTVSVPLVDIEPGAVYNPAVVTVP